MNDTQKKHGALKEFPELLIVTLLSDHLEKLGYNRCAGTFDIEFVCSGKMVRVDGFTCVVEDPVNPSRNIINISKAEATEIIAKAKGIKLNTSDINIERY